jgi:colanic acid biosynthesis glycosyl transferase WcaI
MNTITKPRIVLLYHFFHPDDVVSPRIFTDLAIGLAQRGWDVEAWPCNRACHDATKVFPPAEQWNGITIRRVWRPRFKQASNMGRVLNAAWMLSAWAWRALTTGRHKREVVIIGTDPILSVLTVLPWRAFRSRCAVAHWCFDLYPEAAVADGLVKPTSLPLKLLTPLLKLAYKKCGLLADLGSCMAERLAKYRSKARARTLVPWALVEPTHVVEPDAEVRSKLFGPFAKIGLLYSGSFGRAHSSAEFLQLARLIRGTGIEFCFAGRGNRMDELKQAVQPDDVNVKFAGFAPEAELEARLSACDLHLVSLRDDWTGTVVPSKFFGAIAAGRGVVFVGSPTCAIARWIHQHRLGWALNSQNADVVAKELLAFATDATAQQELRQRCFETYQQQFSKAQQLDLWNAELRKLV